MSKTYCCGCGATFEGEECVSCLVDETKRHGVEEGEKAAEARIVAWLRVQVNGDNLSEFDLCIRATWLALSDKIERGEHRGGK